MSSEKPSQSNVLFIICDDLNNAIEGLGRIPFASAPNLQQLMRTSITFRNAQSNCPICLPSRNSLLSGIYPHISGHYSIMDPWRDFPLVRDSVMMPDHFRRNGYEALGAGKVHHEGAGEEQWWTNFNGFSGYGPFPSDGRKRTVHPKLDRLVHCEFVSEYIQQYRGIDTLCIDDEGLRFAWEQGFGPLAEIPVLKPDPEHGIPGFTGWQNQDGTRYRYTDDEDRDRLPDEQSVDWAVDALRQTQPDKDRPFFMAVGLVRPHTPLYTLSKYFDMFPPEDLELPPFIEGDLDDCARAHVENFPYGHLRYRTLLSGGERMWKLWLQAYLACVAFVDDQAGRLLNALDSAGHYDNTIVVFTSDNGYHMGEKEFLHKNTLWKESGGIPLVIRAPGIGRTGAKCDEPVSLIDIYPTLIDLCNLPENPHEQTHGLSLSGHSLRPLLEDPYENKWTGPSVALSSVTGHTGIHHSVCSATHRYILCENGEEELYDHRNDAHEWHNVACDSLHTKAKTELRRQMMELIEA
jgi:arylsulfatase A-like enzyme